MTAPPRPRPPRAAPRPRLARRLAPWLLPLAFWAGPAWADGRAQALALLEGTPRFSQGDPSPPAAAPWWDTIPDPALQQLIQQALSENNDLLASWSRVEQARARTVTGRAALLPVVTFDASATAAPRDSLGFQFGLNRSTPTVPGATTEPAAEEEPSELYWNGSAKFNATWNIDLWGRNIHTFVASRHDKAAAEGDRDAAAIALATNVAAAWYDVVLAQARLSLLRRQVEVNERMLELVQLRYEGAQTSGLDVLQQRQQLASAQALVPAVEQGVQRSQARLALLLGRDPTTASADLRPGDALPELPPAPSLGKPADLLRTRPELVTAIAQADAATARKKSATKVLLPTVGLNANAGWQGNDISEEWTSQEVWGFGGSVSVPLFAGGRNLGGIGDSRAGEAIATHTLRQRVLSAVQEVEDALLAEQQATAELKALTSLTEAAKLAFEDSRDRYGRGLVNYTTVLQALTVYQSAELQALNARRSLIGARINLHDALGGAWPQALRVAPEEPR